MAFGDLFGRTGVGQDLIDMFRAKKGTQGGDYTKKNVVQNPLVQDTLKGGLTGASTAGALSGGNPFAIAAGFAAGSVGGVELGQRQRTQQKKEDQDRARTIFEAKRSREQLNESLLEQTRTRARFSSNQSGSLLTG